MKLFVQQKYAPFYESTCSLDELDEKPNHSKISKSWNFEGKGCKAKNSFKNHLTKKLCSMDSKYLTLGAGHCVRNNLAKKHVWCPLKLILGIFTFLVINQNIHTELCMNVKIHHCHMNYFKLD